MEEIQKLEDIIRYMQDVTTSGASVGFVPTMGSLHNGHLSLVSRALEHNDVCVASIFINPTQFDDPGDLKRYPVNDKEDKRKLSELGIHVLFKPTEDVIYPKVEKNSKQYFPVPDKFNFDGLDMIFEGSNRPGHFDGVAQVVSRLLQLIPANTLYLGQKDYQQYLILKMMLDQMKLNTKIDLCSIIRGVGGVALSSRNMLLTEIEKSEAPIIFKALTFAKENVGVKAIDDIENEAINMILEKKSVKSVDYFKILNPENLMAVNDLSELYRVIVCTAVNMNKVRLIDNMILSSKYM